MNAGKSFPRFSTYLGIFLTSASILMMELVLTRIFSVKLYYHYAFMVISLALFGSGASGVYVYLFPKFFRQEKLDRHLALFAALYALSIPIVLWLVLFLNFEFSFSPAQMGRVFLLYLIPPETNFLPSGRTLLVESAIYLPPAALALLELWRSRARLIKAEA